MASIRVLAFTRRDIPDLDVVVLTRGGDNVLRNRGEADGADLALVALERLGSFLYISLMPPSGMVQTFA